MEFIENRLFPWQTNFKGRPWMYPVSFYALTFDRDVIIIVNCMIHKIWDSIIIVIFVFFKKR